MNNRREKEKEKNVVIVP